MARDHVSHLNIGLSTQLNLQEGIWILTAGANQNGFYLGERTATRKPESIRKRQKRYKKKNMEPLYGLN